MRLSHRLALAALLASAAALPDARACSVCACGDPLLGVNDPAAITGRLKLQLDADALRQTAANEAEPGVTDELTQWSYRVGAVWRPVEALSLSAVVPFTSKTMRMTGAVPAHVMSDFSGLGDVEVAARWAAWTDVSFGARRVQELALSLGSSLPTGAYRRADQAGEVDMHAQVGTGSWGPFAGVHYRLEQGDWSLFAALSGRLRTGTTLPEGARYRYGDSALWSLHGQWRAGRALALGLGLDGRSVKVDRAVGPGSPGGTPLAAVPNTGGTVLALTPAAFLQAYGDAWLFARVQLPVYGDFRGEQAVRATFTAGVQLQLL